MSKPDSLGCCNNDRRALESIIPNMQPQTKATQHSCGSIQGGVDQTSLLYLIVHQVSRWKKLLFINSHHTVILNFLFLSVCVYLFKKIPQFLSHWELAEPVFCSEELSCLLYKKPKQKPNSGSLAEKIQVCVSNTSFCLINVTNPRHPTFIAEHYSTKALLALVCHFRMSVLSNCNRLT